MSKKPVLFLALVVFCLAAVFISNYWHFLNNQEPQKALFLNYFDNKVGESQEACFSASLLNNSSASSLPFSVQYSGKALFSESLNFKGLVEKEYCIDSAVLSEGDNLIVISFADLGLFYHLEKGLFAEPSKTVLEKPVMDGTGFDFLRLFLGLLVVLFTFFIIFFLILKESSGTSGFALSLGLLVVLFIASFFVLDFFQAVSAASLAAALLAESIFLYFLRLKGLFPKIAQTKASHNEQTDSFNFYDFVAIILLVFIFLFSHLILPTHFQYFNMFYERSTQLVVANSGIPLSDPLSYLGSRPFAFIPGYFMVEASLSLLTGLQGQALFAIMLVFAGLLFAFSLFYCLEAFGLKNLRGLGFLFFASSVFVLRFLPFFPRHMLSFSIMLLAIGVLVKRKNSLFSGLLLGIAAFIQAPVLLFYPFILVFAWRNFRLKQFLKSFAIGIGLFALLFLPIILKFGLPSFAVPDEWGYLIKSPIEGLLLDKAVLLFFVAAFLIIELFLVLAKKQKFLDKSLQWLLFGIVLSVFVEFLVSFRFNIVSSLLIALFALHWLGFHKASFRKLAVLSLLLAVVVFYLLFSLIPGGVVSNNVLFAAKHLKSISSSSDNVLSDPYYGHIVEYLGQRKVLADLWVEYADSGMLDGSWDFLKTGNGRILEKYSIRFVFSQKDRVFDKATSFTELEEPLEFPSLNKVYDDSLIFIHQVPS
ncbi:MAG TPA: hypothetical protein HA227_03930 [Candidatus Diapherotrites archaeon]|uniref:Glycosyltransferase RgtA/B/C/D-like domain-containing protein n=1 Tax=Candidatus Iainarchaeum sp. TaxID=3101447 RepID=A0A7J4KY45_9ARCH|nr:hypothetical protein [Candidatus Diapherotrites archaeon]